MDKLKFKNFIWPRNPETYKTHYTRDLVYNEVSEGYFQLKSLGDLKRVITGNGVFSGETAFEDFKRLEALCAETSAGWLIHPVWGKTAAFLVELEMIQEPRENYVAYSFQFLEATIGTMPEE